MTYADSIKALQSRRGTSAAGRDAGSGGGSSSIDECQHAETYAVVVVFEEGGDVSWTAFGCLTPIVCIVKSKLA